MLVIATPRSGGTAFSIDLAKKLDKPFLGELSAYYLKNNGFFNYKKNGHEIKNSQPDYSDKEFSDMLSGEADGVILVNRTAYLYADKADYILLRDPMNLLMSGADMLALEYPDMPAQPICQYLDSVIDDIYGLITYCLSTNKKVIWFEEHYDCHTPTLIENLSEEKESKIRQHIQYRFKRSDIEEKVEQLRNIS